MSGGKYRATTGKPFLVRAVYLNKPTGGFHVVLMNKNLFVSHSCLGDRPVPMSRQVLIVALAQNPLNVYCDCGMAE